MAIFLIANGPMQTTAAFAAVTTGTSIKTLLQLKASATKVLKIKEWGISFDGSAAATPIKVELIETDVAATVTASVAADITKVDGDALSCGDPTTNLIQVDIRPRRRGRLPAFAIWITRSLFLPPGRSLSSSLWVKSLSSKSVNLAESA